MDWGHIDGIHRIWLVKMGELILIYVLILCMCMRRWSSTIKTAALTIYDSHCHCQELHTFNLVKYDKTVPEDELMFSFSKNVYDGGIYFKVERIWLIYWLLSQSEYNNNIHTFKCDVSLRPLLDTTEKWPRPLLLLGCAI